MKAKEAVLLMDFQMNLGHTNWKVDIRNFDGQNKCSIIYFGLSKPQSYIEKAKNYFSINNDVL